jgi:heme-degrading monooxygenase HmoA
VGPEVPAVFQILWQFEVADERVPAFAEAYGPAGPWQALFRQAQGFVETELYRRETSPVRFLTIDRWTTRHAHEAFRRDRAHAYAALDAACAALALRETFLAAWES